MSLRNHAHIGAAARIPVNDPTPILSYTPVVLHCPDRPVDLELRVTVPATGDALPIVLLSHGHGRSNNLSSLHGYAPLANFWAMHGFAVLQPTHLSSKSLGLEGPEAKELYWRDRPLDMVRTLDQLDNVEAAVPGLQGRLDRGRVAVAGHSLGALTAQMLLGMRNTDPRSDGAGAGATATVVHDVREARIRAGVVLGGTGAGGADLSDNGRRRLPFYGPDFGGMTAPALVVNGDADASPHLTVRGPDWHADAYALAPGPKSLLTLRGGGHILGGVSGYDAAEARDEESPERVAVVQRMSWAYLRSRFYEGDTAWDQACKALAGLPEQATVESKA
ncbi:alpha/beta-hydrolase [Xylariaceae sp. FL0804]|nr:alpha/beta-hydrolase [Xylariaceae sp. FL0804]